ncbi:Clavaminate synthase-like protein [Fomitiporia mediterranea MF3/22]|uniref:Clavaminate synthase-like protein n=1 Tax=Fomitiporia mediterranea (strain MF3/22) TaxID=694068 RepID=UPI00044096C2|nr:Clavaminate synthase-like protein [Fomitiporia mediterranea MF3/22]EJD02232.1 Clavaminate synthase-like protein [Fomitiporia mediterranea MF3/22]
MRSSKSSRRAKGSNAASPTAETAATSAADTDKQRCPQCKDDDEDNAEIALAKEDWVRCEGRCKTWYHWRCVGEGGDLEAIDKWYCKPCLAADPKRAITLKPPARKSARKKPARDYASLHNGIPAAGADKWHALLQAKEAAGAFARDPFKRMKGAELTLEWADHNPDALLEPVLIENPEGLGMSMPAEGLTVSDIAHIVGEQTPVEVMDVATQSNTPGYTLGKWAAYFNTPEDSRDRIRNVISLEISETPLGAQIVPPRIVRDLDWVEKFWPVNKRGPGHAYPKVQLYSLMGVAKAWTDWHIDFAGSSVYYHIHSGAKTFYFIRPTPANLAAYERWSGSELQTSTWLGDLVDVVYKVDLVKGNTMIIPTGWIHAVYTPVDTIVFGGNFLHSYNVATQLHVREIENSTRVPKKFQFPFFTRLCWYVAEASLRSLKAREDFSPRVLSSLEALARFLINEVHLIEQSDSRSSSSSGVAAVAAPSTDGARRKEAKEAVPGDRVKDACALARELRWRVRIAVHGSSDAEDEGTEHSVRTGTKRRRKGGAGGGSVELSSSENGHSEADARLRNFEPKRWDAYDIQASSVKERVRRPIPEGNERPPTLPIGEPDGRGEWAQAWLKFDKDISTIVKEEKEMDVDVENVQPEVTTKHEVMVRVRRTARGLERQRVERTVEMWDWDDDAALTMEQDAS